MTQTSKNPPVLDPAIAALIPNGNKIYDAIMGKIEPELLSSNLPNVEQQYAAETTEERLVRMQRYQKAFADYDAAYDAWLKDVQKAVQKKRADALQKAELRIQQEDTLQLQNLENTFTA